MRLPHGRVWLLLVLLPGIARGQSQDLGHRILGGLGFDAGVQADQGVYVGDRLVVWQADTLKDGEGAEVPIPGLQLDALANAVGGVGVVRFGRGPWLSAAVAVPWVDASISADRPRVGIDRSGLGDLFLEPLRIGWRSKRFDAVAGYSVYVPTSPPPEVAVARSQWTHELAFGGTVFFGDDRGWRLSALASWVHYQKKPAIDVTRGDVMLLQGGFGGPVCDVVEVGVAAYGLWQVTADTGKDLPPVLRGLWERVGGLGPEVDVAIPDLRARLTLRYTWDLGARARPEGSALLVSLTFLTWRPSPPPPR